MFLKEHALCADHDFGGKQSCANRLSHGQSVGMVVNLRFYFTIDNASAFCVVTAMLLGESGLAERCRGS